MLTQRVREKPEMWLSRFQQEGEAHDDINLFTLCELWDGVHMGALKPLPAAWSGRALRAERQAGGGPLLLVLSPADTVVAAVKAVTVTLCKPRCDLHKGSQGENRTMHDCVLCQRTICPGLTKVGVRPKTVIQAPRALQTSDHGTHGLSTYRLGLPVTLPPAIWEAARGLVKNKHSPHVPFPVPSVVGGPCGLGSLGARGHLGWCGDLWDAQGALGTLGLVCMLLGRPVGATVGHDQHLPGGHMALVNGRVIERHSWQ